MRECGGSDRLPIRKMEQLWRLVRESHEQPMTGISRPVELVRPRRTGSHLHRPFVVSPADRTGEKYLIDPVFSKRLIILRRQRRPGVMVDALPPIDLVLLTHAHMDHLDIASLRRSRSCHAEA